MTPLHKSTHKRHERMAAALFGTLRKPGSGSMGRSDETTSDTKHERLYIEAKTRKKSELLRWYREYRPKAEKENKTLVLVTRQTGSQEQIISFDARDAAVVATELLARAYAEAGGPGRLMLRELLETTIEAYEKGSRDGR